MGESLNSSRDDARKQSIDTRRQSIDHAEKEINYRYQLCLFANLFLACMQAGFAIGSNNLVGSILQAKFDWTT